MKVLAFNASPRKDRGNTDTLIDKFIEGAQMGGADVDKHHIVDLDINGCRSCFTCWWKTPGKCVHRDDMDWILPAITDADILVFGTPIFGMNFTHHMQRLAERTFAFSFPEMVPSEGGTTHPSRQRKIPEQVLIATCGFPEVSQFRIVQQLTPTALHIFLPAGQILQTENGKEYLSGFLQAVTTAGEHLARKEPISDELRGQLVIEYTDEMKGEIMTKHNLYSASRMKSI